MIPSSLFLAAIQLLHLAVAASGLHFQPSKLAKVVTEVHFVPACDGLKIGILDLAAFASAGEECSLDNLLVDQANGIVYNVKFQEEVKKAHGNRSWAEHHHGTHASPWYLQQALKSSRHYTTDLHEADVILVNDYCYYIQWLAHVHTLGPRVRLSPDTPGDLLMAMYDRMLASDLWKQHGGSNFVFFEPHTGFAVGKAGQPYNNRMCSDFRYATHLVVDKSMRNFCDYRWGAWPWHKLLVVPYVPNRVDPAETLSHLAEPSLPLAKRINLVFHRATCAPDVLSGSEATVFNAGKFLRKAMADAFQNTSNTMVDCADRWSKHPTWLDFKDAYNAMAHTVFCLVLPGDSSSTRRFSEIFMAGCIPVFVGPPYHSLPFIDDLDGLDYRDASIVLNITNHSAWLPEPMHREFDRQSVTRTDARFWFLEKDARDVVDLPSAEDIPHFLQSVPQQVKNLKLEQIEAYRSVFVFDKRLTQPPNAVNVALAGICRRWNLDVAPLVPIPPPSSDPAKTFLTQIVE